MTSVISHWNKQRGFGFAANPDGTRDIFVHIKQLPRGTTFLEKGAAITFELQKTEKGYSAINVRPASGTLHSARSATEGPPVTHHAPRTTA
jgi:cold shock CspA family protein